ncbi:MAG TPA: winged helix-turn-helix domain-containing protein [Chitinophagaceae bacterium]|nr:winged helix-turn-helix domain-containing protein [Chitinophagaceae bacterium]
MNDRPEEIERHFGQIASLIGEKSRAMMLWNLLDGRAYTATELATSADISFQSASNHLSQLINAGLLRSEKQGRHKYYRFASDRVAQAIENIAALMPVSASLKSTADPHTAGIRYARTCYDHLAGRLGVQVTGVFLKNKWLITHDDRYELSVAGERLFESLDIDISATQKQNRKFAYPCLDWSERNHHLAGSLGAALLEAMISKHWVRKVKHSREILITGEGRIEMVKRFKIDI